MRTKFWRFAYREELLDEIIGSSQICFPNLKEWPIAKNNTEEKILSALKPGHFILLANFDGNTEIGRVQCVGKIEEVDGMKTTIVWKKPVPTWSLTPFNPAGVQQWVNEGVFCFDVNPAKRYKLDERTAKLFPTA